jgi:hypothetical protein
MAPMEAAARGGAGLRAAREAVGRYAPLREALRARAAAGGAGQAAEMGGGGGGGGGGGAGWAGRGAVEAARREAAAAVRRACGGEARAALQARYRPAPGRAAERRG